LAADAVARASGVPPSRWFGLVRRLYREFVIWSEEVRSIVDLFEMKAPLADRQLRLAAALSIARNTFGPKRDHYKLVGAAKHAYSSLGLPGETQDHEHSLVVYMESVYPKMGGFFLTKNGDLALGHRQLRDALAKDMELRRPPLDRPKVCELPDEGLMAKEGPEDIIDGLSKLERLHQVRKVIQARRAKTRAGSLRNLVLEHYPLLKGGDLSIRALAKEKRKAPSALQRAYDREDKAIMSQLTRSPEK
jgi:hypothetical protein